MNADWRRRFASDCVLEGVGAARNREMRSEPFLRGRLDASGAEELHRFYLIYREQEGDVTVTLAELRFEQFRALRTDSEVHLPRVSEYAGGFRFYYGHFSPWGIIA